MDIFAPDIYEQSIFNINYKALKKSGIKCLLFDLDNTLAPIKSTMPGIKEKELIEGKNRKQNGKRIVLRRELTRLLKCNFIFLKCKFCTLKWTTTITTTFN